MLSSKLPKLKNCYAVIGITLLFFGSVWVYLLLAYFPQQARITELKEQLERERQEVQILEAFSLAHPSIDKYIGELKVKHAAVDQMLPAETRLGEFILAAQQAADDAGVELLQIKPMTPLNKAGYREIPVEILVRGGFFASTHFLRKLEEGPRFTLVQNLSVFSRAGELESKLILGVFSFGAMPGSATAVQGKTGH